MSKRNSQDTQLVLGIIYVVISAILTFFITLFATLFDFYTLGSHGVEQYIENISSHDDVPTFQVAMAPIDMYTKPSQTNIFTGIDIGTAEKYRKQIDKGQRFRYFGTINKEEITWVAAQVIDGNSIVNGYLLINRGNDAESSYFNSDENKYFKKMFDTELSEIKGNLHSMYFKSLSDRFTINKETDSLKKQEIINNDSMYIVKYLGTKEALYYTDKNNKDAIEALYDSYLGDNLDAWIIQIQKDYNAERDGSFKKDYVLDIIGSVYFKVSLILAIIYLRRRSKKLKCPECNSSNTKRTKEKISKLGYTYENKDGTPDKRRKNINKEKIEIKTTHLCNGCGNYFLTAFEAERDI